MHLLVADDDSSLRTALRMILEDAGHAVVEAATTAEARGAMGRGTFDFILIDAGMDGLGTSLWREVTDEAEYRERALLLTGDLLALGPLAQNSAVVEKPFDFDGLISRIERAGARG